MRYSACIGLIHLLVAAGCSAAAVAPRPSHPSLPEGPKPTPVPDPASNMSFAFKLTTESGSTYWATSFLSAPDYYTVTASLSTVDASQVRWENSQVVFNTTEVGDMYFNFSNLTAELGIYMAILTRDGGLPNLHLSNSTTGDLLLYWDGAQENKFGWMRK
ncbi:hypothetical protein ACJ72_08435 [Emergomyces africanus]|uniref:Uncharacterized protein n=1 Tax=Emergomyces africanus TaxID=1955775 RepID=A0A1B7NKA8_9EURO|nr:hypothetical protein ACJ72_08435 [Emergomyces africanus]